MSSDSSVSSLLLALPDDVFAVVSRSLSARDLCNLSLCCRSVHALVASEKVWFTQCELVGIVVQIDLIEWRKGVRSYKALFRFLNMVWPLIGIWVHQNPELGNVVYVMPGFISVVGCRIIPQELGPLGIEDGPILWAPVFEILGDFDGSTMFFLHGREKGCDYFYPGSVKRIDKTSNVLLLEVDAQKENNHGKLLRSKSFVDCSDKNLRKINQSSNGISRSQRVLGQTEVKVPFSRLSFSDRRKLLEIVANQVCLKLPDLAFRPLFPRLRDDDVNFMKDMVLLRDRRLMVMEMYTLRGQTYWNSNSELSSDLSNGLRNSIKGDEGHNQSTNRKTFLVRYFRDSLNQLLGKSGLTNGIQGMSKKNSLSSSTKHTQLDEFLRSGDTIGLSLNASTIKLSSFRAWPNMHNNRFALYKLPMQVPTFDQEHAGLWGGTFGWPPGRSPDDKPGKALFFLLLSYKESQGQRLLIASKILEGTHYVLHPNGSAMFIVNVDEPSQDPFPWDCEPDFVSIKHAFTGEGIANGYGFRYPGSKPGSLFVFQNDHLAFVWKESRAVLSLQRLNLEQLLKKGERVPSLPPIVNFAYLTKSYSNVFAGFPNTSSTFSSPRSNPANGDLEQIQAPHCRQGRRFCGK